MKILICTGIYPPDIGGPATYSKLIHDELPKRGIGVDVLSFGEVRKLPKIVRHFVYFCKVLIRVKKADVVFAQDTMSVGFPAMLASKMLGRIFVIRVPGDYVWEQASQRFGVQDSIDDFQHKKYGTKVEFFRSMQKFTCNHADFLITPSIYFRELVSGWVKDASKVIAIYNGIDFSYSEKRTESIDGSAKKAKIIFTAGRLVPWKGFDALIEIIPTLSGWNLVIVGDGADHERLKNKITSLKLNERVQLLGSVSREKLFDLLKNSDIFILNSAFESFSFQTVEAMSVGLPVICARIGNLSEIVADGKEGILVEQNNKDEIISAIKKIENDALFRQMLSDNAIKKSRMFSIGQTMDHLVKLFNSILKK